MQVAQKIYEETEDLEAQDDKTTALYLNAMDKFTKIDPSSIDEINAMMAEVKLTLKQ